MEKYGVDKLAEWKEEEEDFKMRVVDMSEHNTLLNPYDLPIPSGKQQFRMCKGPG